MLKRLSHFAPTRAVWCATLTLTLAASASAWTDKPVRVVVPAVAGGTMDVVTRVLTEELSKEIGAPFFVDNKRGAGGNVAVGALLAAPADGQTIMVAIDNILTEVPHVIKLNYVPFKDIKPVAAFGRSGLVLVGKHDVPAQDLKGLTAYLKANPKQNSFASYAMGSASHYAGVMYSVQSGLQLQHVPFVGTPPALLQVLGGQIPIMFDGIATSLPLIRGGKLKPFAVVSKHRVPALPDVPTLTELGYPQINFSSLAVVIVPAGVSPALTEKIRVAVNKAAAAAPVQKRLAELGLEPVTGLSSEALEKLERDEFARIGSIIKDFKVDLGS